MRISLAQFTPKLKSKDYNLSRILDYLKEAGKQGADLVLFPEMSLTGYLLEEETETFAETLDSGFLQTIQKECRQLNVAAVISFPEKYNEASYICALCIDSRGNILERYHKSHLFDSEKKYFAKGSTYPVFTISGIRIGMIICYDLEFPEVSRLLRLKGADLILVSTANMKPYESYQDVFLKSRAMENEIPMVICNRLGTEGELEFFGESKAVDGTGKVLFHAGIKEGLFPVDVPVQAPLDEKLNYINNIHPDIFRQLIDAGNHY
ncbi:carbon-nitrogen hydrolase family protein [Salibacterium aidingense]|uniref:carbon-nitrogen hydrolase family protein n=1 Tax=Salibacterium aidingense TaxID=384933 RepID=UPI0004230F71|nr:carbon-nitrogen hydrolase family protein [Salibacterium aidingense]